MSGSRRLDPEHLSSLIEAAQRDPSRMDDLLSTIEPFARGVCLKFLPNRLDAEEATQDTLLAVAGAVSTFDPARASVTTWVHTIAANKSRDTYRRLRRRASEVLPEDLPESRRTSVLAGNRIDLLSAAEQIDDRFATAVLLRDLVGLSYEELSETLDVPVGTVRSRLARGRDLMAAVLTEPDPDPHWRPAD